MKRIFLLANLCLAFGLTAPRVLFAESGLIFDQTQGTLTGQLNVSSNIVAAGAVTASSATLTNTAGAGLTVSSSAYLAVSGGNVGIGTTAPSKLLAVGNANQFTVSSAGDVSVNTLSAPSGIWTPILNDQTSASNAKIAFGGVNKSITFNTNSTDRMFINSVGNVGIGTAGPQAALHVYAGNAMLGSPNMAGPNYLQLVHAGSTGSSNRGFISFANNPASPEGEFAFGTVNGPERLSVNYNSGEIFSILPSGNIGIGTTSPGYALDVNGAIRGLDVIAGSSAFSHDGLIVARNSGNASTIYIRANGDSFFTGGNVGIGTTEPAARLQVGTNTSSVSPDVSTLMEIGASNPGGEVVGLSIVNSAAGAAGNSTAINFHNGGNYSSIGGIALISEATFPNSSLVLRYYNGGVKEGLRINSSGNVGIGTTNPSRRLTLSGPASEYLAFKRSTTDVEHWVIGSEYPDDTGPGRRFSLYDSVANAYRMVIKGSNGNVGIGTADPKSKLQVVGLVEYTGNAAAIAAGLTAGAFYRTGEVVKVVY